MIELFGKIVNGWAANYLHKKALLLDLQLDPQYASGYIFHFFILKFEHVADYFTFSLPFVTVTFTFLFLKNLFYLHGMSIYENSWKTHQQYVTGFQKHEWRVKLLLPMTLNPWLHNENTTNLEWSQFNHHVPKWSDTL